MSVKSGQSVTVLFTTQNPTTGAATDATGTPTGTLYVNGTANGASVTVTNITTGLYKAAVTLPSLSAGDVVSLRIAATVSAIAGEGVVWQEVADTVRVSDLNDFNPASDTVGLVTTVLNIPGQQVRDAMKLAPTAGSPAAGSVDEHLDDILTYGGGSGTGSYTDTIDDGTDPLDGVRVQLSTDAEGLNRVYEAFTNASGVFAMNPDPGVYYRWLDLAGYTFPQGVEVTIT